MTPTHRSHDMTDKPGACDIPGYREILIMEDAMRCVCRRCFKQMEGATP